MARPLKKSLSLIIPCYNEEGHLLDSYKKILKELRKKNFIYELIFIDDKSQDLTKKIILQICRLDKNARYIFHKKNIGRGATVSEGIKKAKNNIVGFLDIDLEVSERYIGDFFEKLNEGNDLVIARRQYRIGLKSLVRGSISKIYILIKRIFLGSKFNDTEAGYKFFNKKRILPILKKVKDKKWFWDTEIVMLSHINGLKIGQVSVIFNRRFDKKSTVKLIPDSFDYLINLFKFKKRLLKRDINVESFWKNTPSEFNDSYTNKNRFRLIVNYFLHSRMEKFEKMVEGIDLAGKKVLDVGCGGGQYMEFFLNRNTKVTGIDYSDKMIEMARDYLNGITKKSKKLRFSLIKANAEDLPFQNNTFDLVVSIGLLEYLPEPEKAVFEIYRVLKKDGYALLSFSKKVSPFFFLRIFPGSILRKALLRLPELNRVFSFTDVESLINKSHLKLKKLDEVLYTEFLILCKK